MKTLLLLSIFTVSCGGIEIKDNQVKDNKVEDGSELQDTSEVESNFSYEYEYEYEHIQISSTSGAGAGSVFRTSGPTKCNNTPMASIIQADTWELKAIVDHSDNVHVSLGDCTEVQCPTGFVAPRFNTLKILIDWGIVDLGSEAKHWWIVADNTYIPSDSQYGASNYEQFSMTNKEAYLICLKESAFEHLYVGE